MTILQSVRLDCIAQRRWILPLSAFLCEQCGTSCVSPWPLRSLMKRVSFPYLSIFLSFSWHVTIIVLLQCISLLQWLVSLGEMLKWSFKYAPTDSRPIKDARHQYCRPWPLSCFLSLSSYKWAMVISCVRDRQNFCHKRDFRSSDCWCSLWQVHREMIGSLKTPTGALFYNHCWSN